MNKLFLSTLVLVLTTQVAEARRVIYYKGVYDGAAAKKICKALNATQNKSTGTKHIYANSNLSSLQCNEKNQAWLAISLPAQFGTVANMDNRNGVGDLSFQGEFAMEIYEALNVKDKINLGGSIRKIGKLSCALTFGAEMTKTYTCTMTKIALMTETPQDPKKRR